MVEADSVIPDLIGQHCSEFICQQSWFKGQLVEEAKWIYLKLEGENWYKAHFGEGRLFFDTQKDAPSQVGISEDDKISCPLADIAGKHKLKGKMISNTAYRSYEGKAELTISFEDHTTITICNIGDITSLTIDCNKNSG